MIEYADCGAFDPRDCPPVFLLSQSDACADGKAARYDIRHARRPRWIHGRLLTRRAGDDRALILAGRAHVFVQIDSPVNAAQRRQLYRRVARGLRSISGAPLGPPRLPTTPRALLPARVRGGIARCAKAD